jgi:hypothetical protein
LIPLSFHWISLVWSICRFLRFLFLTVMFVTVVLCFVQVHIEREFNSFLLKLNSKYFPKFFSVPLGIYPRRCNRISNQRRRRCSFSFCNFSAQLSSKLLSSASIGNVREVESSSFTKESHSTFYWDPISYKSLCRTHGS